MKNTLLRDKAQASENARTTGLGRQISRREAINLLGGVAGAALVIGCGAGTEQLVETDSSSSSSGSSSSGGSTSSSSGGSTTGSCTQVAEETNGPFPSDGSNTNNGVLKNCLTDSRVIRRDIRSDFDGSNTQAGTALTLTMNLLNSNGSCGVLSGYYVYIWHCSAAGSYSQYSGNMNGGNYADRTWLRGVQVTDANGQVTFTTIFPGRYSGRATHIHFEVYPASAGVGTSAHQKSQVIATSQLAFPDSVTNGSGSPYTNTTLYPSSATNNTTNANDGIFSDGTSTEMLTISGDNSSGYTASITVAVAA